MRAQEGVVAEAPWPTAAAARTRVVILGAAGRDFHDFNLVFRNDPRFEVVAFTAAQIPNIEHRVYPPELAGPLYPDGISIQPESELRALIRQLRVDRVVFAYSDLSHEEVMHRASLAVAEGADFLLLGARSTMLQSRRPVISVCAVRTGCGKSPVARHLARLLSEEGLRVVIVRHPMPYGELRNQAVQRFVHIDDLQRAQCSLEEMEEYEPHLRAGYVLYAGVDYERILLLAEEEADVLLWDGGNNDLPFFHSDCEIVLADAHRPGHERRFYPGEANLLRADVLVLSKMDTAQPADVDVVHRADFHALRARILALALLALGGVDHVHGVALTDRFVGAFRLAGAAVDALFRDLLGHDKAPWSPWVAWQALHGPWRAEDLGFSEWGVPQKGCEPPSVPDRR